MKIIRKIAVLIIVLIVVIYNNPSKVRAVSLGDIKDGGDIFTSSADDKSYFNESNQTKAVDDLYYILLGIGIVLAIVVGIIIGIKFITTGVEGQAKIKEKLVPYIIGCIVVFGGFGIWRFILNLSSGTLDTNTKIETHYDQDTKDYDAGKSHTTSGGGSVGGGGGHR